MGGGKKGTKFGALKTKRGNLLYLNLLDASPINKKGKNVNL